jgi:GNAT superfamily N-acetyltransferase
VPPGAEIAPLASAEELEALLPAIAGYQRFYEVEEIDEERNRAFFTRFLSPSEDGMILAARGATDDPAGTGELLGYACLYWHLSSLAAAETVLMNDLFVLDAARGRGVGRALIEASAAVGRERGAHSLEWATAPDNARAQALYDSTGATRETWLSYELFL